MEENMEVLSSGSRYVLFSLGVAYCVFLYGSLGVEGLCVTRLDLVIAYGGWREKKMCEN